MNKEDLIKKIVSKKEFSQLPKKDVELAFKKFNNEKYSDEEKVKLSRDLLRKVFSVFTSRKLLNIRDYNDDWILKKHISTKERFEFYREVYSKILYKMEGKLNVFDLGCGVNGFSYKYFPVKISYLGVESIGQLVNLTNKYFEKMNFDARIIHASIFELDQLKDLIRRTKGRKIIFLFKVLDSLEMIERDYSKKLLNEISPLCDKIVISFATESLIKRKKFRINRKWIIDFLKENFEILDDFKLGSERYIVFGKR